MLLIACPSCGLRNEIEFTSGGPACAARPDAATATDAAWTDYLFTQENPKGWMREWWGHVRGCGQWFVVVRHTVTHEINDADMRDNAAAETRL
jgi:heterotetrameric sarcosine oxidase delta subunit